MAAVWEYCYIPRGAPDLQIDYDVLNYVNEGQVRFRTYDDIFWDGTKPTRCLWFRVPDIFGSLLERGIFPATVVFTLECGRMLKFSYMGSEIYGRTAYPTIRILVRRCATVILTVASARFPCVAYDRETWHDPWIPFEADLSYLSGNHAITVRAPLAMPGVSFAFQVLRALHKGEYNPIEFFNRDGILLRNEPVGPWCFQGKDFFCVPKGIHGSPEEVVEIFESNAVRVHI
jgi:hypothetical protein